MAAAPAAAELPLEYLESKFASDSEEESSATAQAPPADAVRADNIAAAADGAAPDAELQDEQWDEEDWTDSDDDDLAAALEWADSREGELLLRACCTRGPGHARTRSLPDSPR